MKAQIKGIGHSLPSKILDNFELEQMVETSNDWILERTGINERRIAEKGINTSDLAYEAACMALEHAEMDASEIDLIIVATATPDMLFPATACMVQDRLSANNAAAFDLAAGCTGFVYALATAERFLESPQYNNVLVIGSETLSRIIDYSDRNTCVLFGDGAGAVVLGKGESEYGIISTTLGADGSGGVHLCLPAGGSARPASVETIEQKLHYIKMNGNDIFRFATKITVEVSKKIFAMSGVKPEEIDLFVPHQANFRIIKTAMKKMNIPVEKTLINIDRFGNMSAACLPVALSMAEREGRLKTGDLVLMVAFGAGLTYGGVLLRWGRD